MQNLGFFSHDNYVIGTNLPADYFVQASCCLTSVSLRITDVAGNQNICSIGSENPGELGANVTLGSLGIAAIVVVVVLVILVAIAIGVIFYIRRKRRVELEEMRSTPQAR